MRPPVVLPGIPHAHDTKPLRYERRRHGARGRDGKHRSHPRGIGPVSKGGGACASVQARMVRRMNKTQTETITPERASALLANMHKRQRRPSRAWVKILSGRIKRGEWDMYAGFIIVDEDGRLVDGQHRCLAIVDAGISVGAAMSCKPWSKYGDDVRRRSCGERNGESKDVAAVARFAGRIIGIPDGDHALAIFSSEIKRLGIDAIQHATPWRCAASSVGALAAGERGVATIRRLMECAPENDRERALCVKASAGKIRTTGEWQYDTCVAVYSAAVGKRSTIEHVRYALSSIASKS